MRRAVKRYIVSLEFLIVLGILPGCVWSVPTARVIVPEGVLPEWGMPLRGTAGERKTRKRETAKAPNKLQKTRRVPAVRLASPRRCTLCWAICDCGDKPLQPLLNLLSATLMR
jgi:hypothetical protein